MPRVSDHEEFLNTTMVEEGEILVILDPGRYLEPEETGFTRTVFHIRVGLPDQRAKTWSMNKTTQRRLAKAYGDDTASWVNRHVQVEIARQMVRGEPREVLYGRPVKHAAETQPK